MQKKAPSGGNRRRILNASEQEALLEWIDSDCTLTLEVLKRACLEQFGKIVSLSTISRVFRAFHYTIKRVRVQPERRNDPQAIAARREYAIMFIEIMSRRESMYFVDESGFNCSMRIHHGRSMRGQPAVVRVPSIRAKNFSLCAAYSMNSMFHVEI